MGGGSLCLCRRVEDLDSFTGTVQIAENAAAFVSSKVEVGECALSRNGIVHSLPTA